MNVLTTAHILCLKNASFYSLNNVAKNEPILVIFGVQNHKEISHEIIKNSPTSPE